MKFALAALLALAPDLQEAKDAPAVKIKTVDGKEYDLAAVSKEKVVVIVSWSFDCPSGKPCIGRADAIGEKLAGNEKVLYLGVSSYGDVADKLAAYAKEKEIKYSLCHDEGKAVAKALGAKKVNSVFVFAKGKLFWSGGITAKGDDPVLTVVEAAIAGTPAPAANKFSG
jgi:peroxiredoxin